MIVVDTIENGTVIDHIEVGKGRKVLDLLEVDERYPYRAALVINVPSKKMGKKDIVKVEGKFLSEEKTNTIALVSPNATINLIKNSTVVEKRKAELPKEISGIGKCPNPNCISHTEPMKSKFVIEDDDYRCFFCERVFKPKELI